VAAEVEETGILQMVVTMLQSPHTAHLLVLGGASRAGRSKSQCRDGSPKQNRQILARASRAQATRWQYESQWVKWEKGDGVLGAVINVRIVGVVGRQMDSLRQVRQENLSEGQHSSRVSFTVLSVSSVAAGDRVAQQQ